MENEFRLEKPDIVIMRSNKIVQMYDIDFPAAHKDIEWNSKHHVPFCETRLLAYSCGGKEVAEQFTEWAEQFEKELNAKRRNQ